MCQYGNNMAWNHDASFTLKYSQYQAYLLIITGMCKWSLWNQKMHRMRSSLNFKKIDLLWSLCTKFLNKTPNSMNQTVEAFVNLWTNGYGKSKDWDTGTLVEQIIPMYPTVIRTAYRCLLWEKLQSVLYILGHSVDPWCSYLMEEMFFLPFTF